MTIHEKLERLTEVSKKATVCRLAGLSPATLHNVLQRKHSVTARVAVALARVLRVDVGWLIDDDRDWPPVCIEEPEECNAA